MTNIFQLIIVGEFANITNMSIQDFTDISAIGVIALFIWVVAKPLISVLIKRMQNNVNRNGYAKLDARMNKLENNHLTDINRRLNNLEQRQESMRSDIEAIKIKLAKLEAKIK